jgi:hypothetical protein
LATKTTNREGNTVLVVMIVPGCWGNWVAAVVFLSFWGCYSVVILPQHLEIECHPYISGGQSGHYTESKEFFAAPLGILPLPIVKANEKQSQQTNQPNCFGLYFWARLVRIQNLHK